MGPSLAVCRELGPQGSLGLWLKGRDGEKGGRVGEEEGKEAGARSKRWGGARRGREGRRARFLPGVPVFQGIPTVGQAVFCFGNVTETSKAFEETNLEITFQKSKVFTNQTPHPPKENTTCY